MTHKATPLALLRHAWQRASHAEREQFLEEVLKEVEQQADAAEKALRQRRRRKSLGEYLYPSPPRK